MSGGWTAESDSGEFQVPQPGEERTLPEIHGTKAGGFSSPGEDSSGRRHFDLSGFPGGGFLGEGASEWCFRIPTFPGSGSVVITDTILPVSLGRRRTERRVEVICFNFHWLVFLWHSSKREMESD